MRPKIPKRSRACDRRLRRCQAVGPLSSPAGRFFRRRFVLKRATSPSTSRRARRCLVRLTMPTTLPRPSFEHLERSRLSALRMLRRSPSLAAALSTATARVGGCRRGLRITLGVVGAVQFRRGSSCSTTASTSHGSEVTVQNSPSWQVVPYYTDDMIIRNVRILGASQHSPNTYAIDPFSSSNMVIDHGLRRCRRRQHRHQELASSTLPVLMRREQEHHYYLTANSCMVMGFPSAARIAGRRAEHSC